jgi:hypothetical protein
MPSHECVDIRNTSVGSTACEAQVDEPGTELGLVAPIVGAQRGAVG